MPTVSLSSWPLHHLLGEPPITGPGQTADFEWQSGHTLLDVIPQIAAHGYNTMEICHFHLESAATEYLTQVHEALEANGIRLLSLLVDGGDISHPEHGGRDYEWIAGWLPAAVTLGAERMRVIAGRTKGETAVATIIEALLKLSHEAEGLGIRITVENWWGVADSPEAVVEILEATDGKIGFNMDFGNWSGPDKYENLSQVAGYAETCHAQANFTADGTVEGQDYGRILEILKEAGFSGPFTLVASDQRPDPWPGLNRCREFIQESFA